MELYSINKNYLDYVYRNVDKEVLYTHISHGNMGRANVLVMKAKYKGEHIDFAVPEKGEVKFNSFEECVILDLYKKGSKFPKGFVVSKLMPIIISLTDDLPMLDQDFFQIATEITRKEPELIAKTQAHLKRLEMFAPSRFSTNVDKQLLLLRAYMKLRRVGVSEREIYGRGFAENVNLAKMI